MRGQFRFSYGKSQIFYFRRDEIFGEFFWRRWKGGGNNTKRAESFGQLFHLWVFRDRFWGGFLRCTFLVLRINQLVYKSDSEKKQLRFSYYHRTFSIVFFFFFFGFCNEVLDSRNRFLFSSTLVLQQSSPDYYLILLFSVQLFNPF